MRLRYWLRGVGVGMVVGAHLAAFDSTGTNAFMVRIISVLFAAVTLVLFRRDAR